MSLPRARPAPGRILAVAFLGLIAGLSASCSATSTATSIAPRPSTAPAAAGTPATATPGFTVSGTRPVTPNGSQDTAAATPKASCDRATFSADQAIGTEVADGFAVAGFPAASSLLRHFLTGKGTEIDYRPGSLIATQALASTGFRTVNAIVQAEIARQLKAGDIRVALTAAQLPTVTFGSAASDLYWGFRGTQGLTVAGSGHSQDGRYAGTLTYVIRDSYGFPADDPLGGFGAPMRYLQTACGAPQHAGGARWFPDAITVTVPFSRAAAPA